jgi:phosphate transport system substrate-binding protein
LIRNRLLALFITIAGAAGGLVTVSPAAASAADITGAGSTLVAPLMANWISGYEAHRRGEAKVTYGSVGSGAGISQITSRTVDFGASDAPLTPEQAAACNGCVQIPWGLSAIGIGYNLPGVKKLKMTSSLLVGIYFGKITKWNDPKIQKVNKDVKLPNLPITPVFRTDGSGTTYGFVRYLSKVSPAWKKTVGYATSVSFPTGVGGKGNSGVTAAVASTKGAIGYIEASYILAADLPAASVKNKAGKFLYPNLENIVAAAAVVKKVPPSNTLTISDPPKKAKDAYPISTFTYGIVPQDGANKEEVKKFAKYAVTIGQKYGAALDFAPLPKVVKQAALKAIGSL